MKPKKPIDIYSTCPGCGSEELLMVGVDVLCCVCDWDSTESHVSAGGMDSLVWGAREFFENSQPVGKKCESKKGYSDKGGN